MEIYRHVPLTTGKTHQSETNRLTGTSVTGCMAGDSASLRTRNLHLRERTLLPDLPPSACVLLRFQAGPHAGAWLTAIPADPATALSPQAMQLGLRRRLRLHSAFTPPPSKSVRPLSRMRRARRRLRRPCLGLPSHWALGSASQDRRTGISESCRRSRWGRWPGGLAAMSVRHHCSRRCA